MGAAPARQKGKRITHDEDSDDSYYDNDEGEYTDEEMEKNTSFKTENKQLLMQKQNIWILKPGENSNRGHGINVASEINEVRSLMRQY